jgi:hypothetical protein
VENLRVKDLATKLKKHRIATSFHERLIRINDVSVGDQELPFTQL